MKHIGHPLFSDNTYGGDKIRKGVVFSKYKQFIENCFTELPRQALHAKTLGFVHPATKEDMFFESELPNDMETVIQKWRNVSGTYDFSQKWKKEADASFFHAKTLVSYVKNLYEGYVL